MAKPGFPLDRQIDKNDIIDAIYEHGGIIKNIAKHLNVTRKTIYEYLDIYPEAREAQVKADDRLRRHVVENAYETYDKLLEKVDDDSNIAFKVAESVLKRSKHSHYYDKKEIEESVSVSPILLKNLSEYKANEAAFKDFQRIMMNKEKTINTIEIKEDG